VPRQFEGVERYGDGGIRQAELLFIADVPALGYAVYHVGYGPAAAPPTALACTGDVRYGIQHQAHEATIENEFYRLTLDNWGGQITSLWDKRLKWEVIDPERPWGNVLTKEPDHGDLWEINGPCKGGATTPTHRPFPFPEPWAADFSHRYGGNGTSIPGPVCVQHRLPGPFGAGRRETVVRLYHRLPRIEFETHLTSADEWVRYRVAFPTVLRGGVVIHEIPFGALERPAGEYPAQNWIDVSDGPRGLALLNQGLPGNNVDDGVLMLSLLRAVMNRGMDSDGGFEKDVPHVFRYALVPHAGTYRQAHIYRAGLEFNHPFQVRKVACRERTTLNSSDAQFQRRSIPAAGSIPATLNSSRRLNLPSRHSFVRVTPENAVLSALKPTAEGLIVRVYEAAGARRTSAVVALPGSLARAEPMNLRERSERGQVFVEGNELRFHLKPFQVRTFRVGLKT
jgi:alpha-mannosidase